MMLLALALISFEITKSTKHSFCDLNRILMISM